ncbi:MAG: restriction endonuclease subunit S [Anaerolineaceae bacterium]|nr:restriction endonuclease subunit S [Anaerolineaceae bacterium]
MKFNAIINDIAEIVMGQSPKGKECNNKGLGLPLLNGPTEFTSRSPIPVQFTEAGNKFAEPDDILFCVRGSTTGKMNYADQCYVIGRGIASIRGKNGYPTPYVRAVLEQNLDRLLASATGSTFPNVGRDLLNNFEINSVSPEDAREINKLIISLEYKIELNRQINQTLESMAQTIFKSWFVDFDPVKAKIAAIEAGEDAEGITRAAMRAISGKTDDELGQMQAGQPENYAQLKTTAGLFPAAMQESELGEVPEGWEVMQFSKLANLDTTSVKPHNEPGKLWEHYSIPAFDVNEAPNLELGSEIKSNKYKVNPTAILSSKLNPNTPRTWWPDVEDETSAICSTEFMQFVPTDVAQRTFIFGLVTSDIFQSGIKQRVTGSTGSRQRAQPRAVAEIDVVKPKEELVFAYCSHLTELPVLKAKNIKENITLAQLRDTLLPKLLSGELSVDAIEMARGK